jgi:hypothetical protein
MGPRVVNSAESVCADAAPAPGAEGPAPASVAAALRKADLPVLLLAAAVLTAVVFQASLRHGRLAHPPRYDDVYYLSQGAVWLARFESEGVLGVLREYIVHPPHSVFSVGLAAVCFAIFGVAEWAPYIGNVVVVLAYLAAGRWAFRGVSGWQRLGGSLLIAMLPLTVMGAHEFRPDAMAALFQALGIMLVFSRPVTAPGWGLFRAGLAIGASLLCKPSVFIATGIASAGAIGLATAAEWIASRPPWRAFLRPWALFAAGLLSMAALYPPVGWAAEWHYFYTNIMGDAARFWAGSEGLWTHLRWYLTGPAGRIMLGTQLYLLLAIAGIGALHMSRRGGSGEGWRVAAMGCLLLLLWAMASLNRMKSEFLGLPFQVLLVLASLSGFAAVLRGPRGRLASFWLVVALGASVLFFRMPHKWSIPVSPGGTSERELVDGVYDAVRKASGGRGGSVLVTTVGMVTPGVLDFYSARDDADLEFRGNIFTESIDSFRDQLAQVDYVIVAEEGIGPPYVSERYGSAEYFPYAHLQNEMIAAIESEGDFDRIARYPVGPNGESFMVFRRQVGFTGFEGIEGLGPEEGPYRTQHLPIVRWGLVPGTRIKVHSDGLWPLRFAAIGRSWVPDQHLQILQDEREVASADLVANDWRRVEARLDLPAGDHEIELRYRAAGKGPNAVLFRSMTVTPVSPDSPAAAAAAQRGDTN